MDRAWIDGRPVTKVAAAGRPTAEHGRFPVIAGLGPTSWDARAIAPLSDCLLTICIVKYCCEASTYARSRRDGHDGEEATQIICCWWDQTRRLRAERRSCWLRSGPEAGGGLRHVGWIAGCGAGAFGEGLQRGRSAAIRPNCLFCLLHCGLGLPDDPSVTQRRKRSSMRSPPIRRCPVWRGHMVGDRSRSVGNRNAARDGRGPQRQDPF